MDFSHLETEWHPTKNLPLIFNVKLKASGKYWWLGKCGHEWEATLTKRLGKKPECFVCSSLAIVNPKLAAEWHPTKNGKLTPNQISPHSNIKVWWVGKDCGHEWDALLNNRTKGKACPVCTGRRVLAGYNDLATKSPETAAEWHPVRNGELTAQQVTVKANKRVWWLGKCGHEWESTPGGRASGYGCAVCAGLRVQSGFNDLATVNPELAAEWHPVRNGELTAQQVTAGTDRKIWWLGKCGHEWEAALSSRRNSVGAGCPVCKGFNVLVGFNDLATVNPELAAEWHPTKNGNLTPQLVTGGSSRKIWWLGKCGHEWEAILSSRATGIGCPFCAGQLLFGFNDLATVNPKLAAEWHPRRNGELLPTQVTCGSSRVKVWWLGKCGHEWETTVIGRAGGTNCPICAGQRVLIYFNDLTTIFPIVAGEWHPTKNEQLLPTQTLATSDQKVWWLGTCGHEWKTTVRSRTTNKSRCPICAGQIVLTGFNDLETKNPLIAAEWHPTKNGQLLSTEVISGSHKKVWWLGACGHEWKTSIKNRTRLKGGGCGKCSNHVSGLEEEIRVFLTNLGLKVESSNRKILKGKEIDLWIPEKKVGIEFNGIYWHTETWGKDRRYHYDKWLMAKKAGVELIQIWEDDWNLRHEIIKRTLAHILGVATTGSVALDTQVVSITEQQAEEFLTENHLQGFASGLHYLGLVETGDIEKLQAVMVLEDEPNSEGKSLEIIRYASISNSIKVFSELLTFAINAYSPESITVTADHCEADDELYVSNGFIAEKELPPDYMYVIRTERKTKAEYPLERFRDDPKLLWKEGLTEMELADLNGLNRIWDAGKTRYRYFI